MYKFGKGITAAVMTAAALAFTALPAQAELKRITIGTNPQGTLYFVVGGGMSKLFSDKLNIQSTAQPYAGSSVYLPLIQSNEVTFGYSSSLDSGMAYGGKGPYDGAALSKLRSLGRAWPLPYAYFAKKSSGMKTVADLKGKKVATDFKANASLDAANRAMLKAAGLDPEKDVTTVTISGIPEGYSGVTEGRFDAAATALAIPLAVKADTTIPGGIIMLEMTGPNANTAFLDSEIRGFYMDKTKPSSQNPGVDREMAITGFDVFMIIGSDVSDDDAYMLIKTLHENWKGLQESYKVLGRNPAEMLGKPSNTVPYHPGAIRYFKEAGLWTAENDAREKALMK
jgi:hypothetical protein